MKKKASKNSRVKYPGITQDANELGVSRQHLFDVLEGKRRTSKSLSARYAALKAKQHNEKGGSN